MSQHGHQDNGHNDFQRHPTTLWHEPTTPTEVNQAGSPPQSVIPHQATQLRTSTPINWTASKIIKLIHLYKEKEMLWNSDAMGYKRHRMGNLAWMSLGEAMDIEPAECRRKMRGLLSQFYREHQKEGRLAATGKRFVSTWFPYPHMDFLKSRRKQRKSCGAAVPSGYIYPQHHKPGNSSANCNTGDYKRIIVEPVPIHGRLEVANNSNTPGSSSTWQGTQGSFNNQSGFPNVHGGMKIKENANATRKESSFPQGDSTQEDTEEDILSSFGLQGSDFGVDDIEIETPSSPLERKFVGPHPTSIDGPTDESEKRDGPGIFGAYVAAKLRFLASEAARDRVECLISNVLFEGSKGSFDGSSVTFHGI